MTYRAPLEDIAQAAIVALDDAGDPSSAWSDGSAQAVLSEAARFAEEKLAPLSAIGDRIGARQEEGRVLTPPGWREAYGLWRAGGWSGLTAPSRFGGAELPRLLGSACLEIWSGANMAFMLCPLLSFAAIDALAVHGSSQIQKLFLEKIVSGEWTATMNLTEPQAGSDLSEVRTRAVPSGDGRYRLFGQKIFITYGDHDLSDNIVHLVLARSPGGPAGTRGLSLFLAPKFRVKEDGAIGAPNDLRCLRLEHKLGIHAAPTCAMIFGEDEGAEAFLIGEPNKGLACMFTMMNNARLAVGLEGVGQGERATQAALAYARERRQGRAAGETGQAQSAILAHPDVRRMLMTMKASTAAARALCYRAAAAMDAAEGSGPGREAAGARAALLTPIAKAFATDLANETASLGLQVFGGAGYVEETGAAQILRDARIAAIYEGTNGIQAIDLVARKLPMRGGAAARAEIAAMRATLSRLEGLDGAGFGAATARLHEAVESLSRSTDWMLAALERDEAPRALAGAVPYLRLFGLASGGVSLALSAAIGVREAKDESSAAGRVALARFFAENMVAAAGGLETAIVAGADAVLACDPALGEAQSRPAGSS